MSEASIADQLRKAVNVLVYRGKIKTDGDIAGRLKYSKGTVSAYLSGTSRPSKAFVKKFEKEFELSLKEINGGSSPDAETETAKQNHRDPTTEELLQSYRDMIQQLKHSIERTERHNDILQDMVQSNLRTVLKNQAIHEAAMEARQDTILSLMAKDEADLDKIFDTVYKSEVQKLKEHDGTDIVNLQIGSSHRAKE